MLEGDPVTESLRATVRWTFKVVGPETADEPSNSAERVMEALLDLEACDSRLCDSGVAMDATDMTVDIELTATGGDAPDTLRYAQTAIRAAIHAAGDGAPEWPDQMVAERRHPHSGPRPIGQADEFQSQQVEMLAS
ncbi:hypothetical protein GCM10009639_09750 [Kitasatospora putterlickiae]|uniref:Uncharacterized protein n=1 Tax=Kitasatospora putterlickiae TaxID=221725 RepID=A0ABN1XUA7_9ACTN